MSKRAAALFAIWVVTGCAREADPLPALVAVPHPELAGIEEVVRKQLEAQRAELEARLGRGDDARVLADAFGGMGELYHAYELTQAAAACYANAERLDPRSFLWPYYSAVLHQEAGALPAAAESLERALEHRPGDLPARLRLGEVRLALGDAAGAREHFEALFADEAYAAAAHFGLGRAAAADGDYRQAAEHFKQTLELQPRAGIVHHSLGMALRRLDRPEEARGHLEMRASGEVLAPDRLMERVDKLAVSSGAYLERGNRALMRGELNEAAAMLSAALEADPTLTEARRNLAHVLMRRGDPAAAIEQLETAIESDPEDVWLHVDLANAFLQRGFAERAVDALRRAVELDPGLVQAHFNLANALIGLERWAEAGPHLDAVLRIEAGHWRARYLRAMTRHQGGETADAIRELRTLLDAEPTCAVVRQALAKVLQDAGRPERAMAVYREGLDLEIPAEEKAELLEALARLAWQRGARQEAVGHWRRATEIVPASSQAFTNLANALQLLGQREEARQLFARAVELDPDNATARLSEASLWILAGELATARERLEAAVAVSPDHPGLNHTLARLLATASKSQIRDGRRALALANQVYSQERSLEHAETVAMALAELGRFEEAIRWQRGLVNQAAAGGDRGTKARLMTSLRLYENRQPVRVKSKTPDGP